MGTKLHLKVIGFSICLVLTFGIAGLHARVSVVKNDDTVRVLQEPLQAINSVSITKEAQNLTQKNISEPEAVDEPDKLQSITKIVKIPQKELSVRQAQENEKPVMVMASVDMKAMNKIEKPMDSISVQSSDKPILLTQNKTVEKHDSKAIAVPDNVVQNDRPVDAANDSKKEDIDTVFAELSRQIELNNSDAGLYVLRGNLHMDKQDYRQAVNDYTKAIEINPDNVAAYNNRGQAYANMGEYKQAIKDYKKAIKKDPENKYAYINRGNTYLKRQYYIKAISDYTRAIKIDPEFSLAYINRGITYYTRANKINPEFSLVYRKWHINDYTMAIKIDPEFSLEHMNRGSLSKAIKDFSKALKLNVRDAGTYLLRGNAYYRKREYRQAINDYKKALEINPDSSAAYNFRSDVYSMMGNMVEYKKDKLMAMQLNPYDEFLLKAKAESNAVQRKQERKREHDNDIRLGSRDCVNCGSRENSGWSN